MVFRDIRGQLFMVAVKTTIGLGLDTGTESFQTVCFDCIISGLSSEPTNKLHKNPEPYHISPKLGLSRLKLGWSIAETEKVLSVLPMLCTSYNKGWLADIKAAGENYRRCGISRLLPELM